MYAYDMTDELVNLIVEQLDAPTEVAAMIPVDLLVDPNHWSTWEPSKPCLPIPCFDDDSGQ